MARVLRGDESVTNMKKPDLFLVPAEISDAISASTTLDRNSLGKVLYASSGSAIVLTVPADTSGVTFIEGETFTSLQYGTGQLSFAAANGVTIRTPSGLNAAGQFAIIGVMRLPTANEWVAFGNLTA